MENETAIICPLGQKEDDLWRKQYESLKKNRIFFIDYEIDESYALIELSKAIVEMNANERYIPENELQPIQLWIHSYGGDTYQARFFCDLVEASRIPIITVATGAAMSCGLLILLSGKRRYAFKQSEVLIHQGYASFSGTAQEIEEAQTSYKKQLKIMKSYILERTKISDSLFKKQEKKDWYVSGEELISLGIVDKIVSSITDIK